jgi:betaine-homocysteine S-methyltransferase
MSTTTRGPGLLERLEQGPVICAEGYLFEIERRGYLQAGAFVPEAVLAHPEVVRQVHRDFAHAGSDVIQAFTYYGHRDKLRVVGKEDLLEPLNRQALALAREVAEETGALFAGNISNTNVFEPTDAARDTVRGMFEEQVAWAAEAGVDYVIAETYSYTEEALIALEVIKAAGLPAVVTMALHREPKTRDGDPIAECCRKLAEAGAAVVGVNCTRGPRTMLPVLKDIREAVPGHVAALPVPFRTSETEPTFQSLTDPGCDCLPDGRPFPTALDPFTCNRFEIAEFARQARDMGVDYLGLCCGAQPHHLRSLAEALGRRPPASRYSPDMSKHSYFGSDEKLRRSNLDYAKNL